MFVMFTLFRQIIFGMITRVKTPLHPFAAAVFVVVGDVVVDVAAVVTATTSIIIIR
jgi:hypothetical protein